jgi:predicted Zn finger-like uncharacterized protein
MIVCPTCATSYMVDPASLGAAGRSVRCARCKTTWHAGGPALQVAGFVADVIAEAEAEEAPLPARRSHTTSDDFGAEPPMPASRLPAEDFGPDSHAALPSGEAPPLSPVADVPPDFQRRDVEGEDIESFAARRVRLQAKRKVKRRSSKWTALVLVLFGFNVALVGARSEVVRYLPQTASLFAAIGLPVNLRNLTFEDVHITKEERDGVPVLSVEGNIVSLTTKAVEVPRLRFAVRNSSGQEIYAWSAAPTRSILPAGEKLPFRSRLASPPADASDVMVRFINANDADTGTK